MPLRIITAANTYNIAGTGLGTFVCIIALNSHIFAKPEVGL